MKPYIITVLLLAFYIAAIGQSDCYEKNIKTLVEKLSNKDPFIQETAAETLEIEISKSPSKALWIIPNLIKMLRDDDKWVRMYAVKILGAIGTRANEAVPELIERLKDADWIVQVYAIDALGKIGLKSTLAVHALTEKLNDEDAYLRQCTVIALGTIITEEQTSVLIKALADNDIDVVKHAQNALVQIGVKALPDLVKALKNTDSQVKIYAAEVLGNLGNKSISAIPSLLEALKTNELYLKKKIADAIIKIKPELAQTIPEVIDALQCTLREIAFDDVTSNCIIEVEYQDISCFQYYKNRFIFKKQNETDEKLQVLVNEIFYKGKGGKNVGTIKISQDEITKLDNLFKYYRKIQKEYGGSTTVNHVHIKMIKNETIREFTKNFK